MTRKTTVTVRPYRVLFIEVLFEFQAVADYCKPGTMYSNFLSHGQVTWCMGRKVATTY